MYTLELGVFMYRFSIDDLLVAFENYFSKRFDVHDYVNDLNLPKIFVVLIFDVLPVWK